MALKLNTGKRTFAKGVHVKFVRRAGMWCKTYAVTNEKTGIRTQKQQWSVERPDDSLPED